MKKTILIFLLFINGVLMAQTQKTTIKEDSLFGLSQKTGLNYVLDYEADRFLAPCYRALGKVPPAINYGGWESRQIQGHMLGHYLSALSSFYHETASQAAKEKLDYTVSQIKKLQRSDGYFAGIPSDPFDRVFASGGNFEVERFSLAGWWVPWYSVHKIYAGLIDAYLYGQNEAALKIVTKMADWAISGTRNMSDESLQKMLTCEHGGMCKVFADLYGITGNKKYLKEAERWIHQEIIKPAMQREDKLQGYHANTQIPKFIGIARLYELTGKEQYRTAAEFFFETVTRKRSYAIGGNSRGEHFGREFEELLTRDTCETCNTYNMLELCEHIFSWNKKSEYADFYEKALYNHILASQDPDSGAKTYFVAMQPGFHKVYCSHDNAMWCCTGTGLENPARYNRFIACEEDDCIYINLFIPSVIEASDGSKLSLESNFPYDDEVKIRILEKGSGDKKIKVRLPSWCKKFKEEGYSAGDDGYITLANFQKNDDFEFLFPMELGIRYAQDHSGYFSIKYGPVILAADLGNEDLPEDIVDDHLVYMTAAGNEDVEIITADLKNPSSWISEVDRSKLLFRINSSVTESGIEYNLKPFFALHHSYYSVYFPSKKAELDPREEKFNKITVDFIECGRQQSEVEHSYKTKNTKIGYINELDSNCREFMAEDSFVSYKLKVKNPESEKIVLTFSGNDRGEVFLSAGKKSEKILLEGNEGDEFTDREIPVSFLFSGHKKSASLELVIKASSGIRLLQLRSID